jgi:hypothetical protein
MLYTHLHRVTPVVLFLSAEAEEETIKHHDTRMETYFRSTYCVLLA